MSTLPLQFLLITIAGWMTRGHQQVTEYLLAENAVLREERRGRRLRYARAELAGVTVTPPSRSNVTRDSSSRAATQT